MVSITKKESDAIDSLRLLCVLSVVMIHSSVLLSSRAAHLACEFKTEIFAWHQCLCFIPNSVSILFVLSGYLYFRNIGEQWDWNKHYLGKLKSRKTSLFLFYIVWCFLGISYDAVVGRLYIPSISDFFIGFWPREDSPCEWGLGMWFIRTLIAFTLLSPLYYIVVKKLGHITPILCLFLHSLSISDFFPYFNIYLLFGSYLGYKGISLSAIAEKFDWRTTMFILLLLHILEKSGLLNIHCNTFVWVMLVLITFIGLFLKYPISRQLTTASTFIYAAHFFFIGSLKYIFMLLLPVCLTSWILNMVLSWASCIVICLVIYKIITKFPFLCSLLTGGRSAAKSVNIHEGNFTNSSVNAASFSNHGNN